VRELATEPWVGHLGAIRVADQARDGRSLCRRDLEESRSVGLGGRVSCATSVSIYVGNLRSIPKELEEAAVIDSASVWGTFWKVIFPLLTPINATVGIIMTVWIWNDFMLPLVMLSERDSFTLPLVQYVFQSQFTTDFSLAFASYLMALTPLLVVHIVAQRWVIGGVTRGAVK
jgi:raffinose/stachyose/melibiose transport system permease protein